MKNNAGEYAVITDYPEVPTLPKAARTTRMIGHPYVLTPGVVALVTADKEIVALDEPDYGVALRRLHEDPNIVGVIDYREPHRIALNGGSAANSFAIRDYDFLIGAEMGDHYFTAQLRRQSLFRKVKSSKTKGSR
ncbi:MAG: hypothetical protein M3Q44_05285 [bacterium]|nr:hypothetical protein [bacterium]